MEDYVLQLLIQPKASKDAFVGWMGNEIKVAITAPPVDGKANEHLKKFLAKQFKTAPSQVEITKGQTGRHKTVTINNAKQIPTDYAKLLQEKPQN